MIVLRIFGIAQCYEKADLRGGGPLSVCWNYETHQSVLFAMVCTSSSSSESSSSSSSDSDCESEVGTDEKKFSPTQEAEKNAEKVDEKKSADKKADSKVGKKRRNKEREKQEGKKRKEEKSVILLRKVISKQKEAQQKTNKKLALALKQVGVERRKQLSEINKLKRKRARN